MQQTQRRKQQSQHDPLQESSQTAVAAESCEEIIRALWMSRLTRGLERSMEHKTLRLKILTTGVGGCPSTAPTGGIISPNGDDFSKRHKPSGMLCSKMLMF